MMTPQPAPLKIAIGPVLYYWSAADMTAFYRDLADSAADIVYIGETVCAKRQALSAADYLAIARLLQEAGKEVVLSTLTLIESPADLRSLRKLCDNGEFFVEANDMGAVGLLREQGLPFVAGAAINCYNAQALHQLVQLGMTRWVVPVEMSREWLQQLLAQAQIEDTRSAFAVEVFGFGHVPLAWSARCFTARSENRAKDDCQLCCLNYPDGRPVDSQDGARLFTLNGIQTLSGPRYNLINDLAGMPGLVDAVRISPQSHSTVDWITAFDCARRGKPHQPRAHSDTNGYWHRLAGIKTLTDDF